MANIPRSAGIDDRERDAINLVGLRIYMSFRNSLNQPLGIRVALMAPKASTYITNTNFFQGYNNSRGVNFATTLTSPEFIDNSINRDLYDDSLTRARTTSDRQLSKCFINDRYET